MQRLIGLRRLLVASWAMVNLMTLAFMALYAKPEAIGAISLCIGGVITVTGFFFGQRALEKPSTPGVTVLHPLGFNPTPADLIVAKEVK
jgi:hypothetical protein